MRIRVLILWILAPCWLTAQDFSNRGTDFWLAYGNHVRMFVDNRQEMVVYISATEATNYTIEIPGLGWSSAGSVGANQVATSTVIPKTGATDARLMSEGKFNKGIHITSDKPIVAYLHIYNNNISGAGVLFPTQTLGKEYISINYTQVSNERDSYSFFFVVASEDGTTVEITPSQATLGGRAAGVAFTETLNKGEVYHVMSATDLTGSRIRSVSGASGVCKRIAVFSGSGKINISEVNAGPNNTADNIIQQVFPVSAWGKHYITVPTSSKPNNFFRIIVKDPSTVVTVNGSPLPVGALVAGTYYDLGPSSQPNVINADKPIMVAQYITSQNNFGNTGNSDPEMIFLSPVEQTIDNITLFSTPNFGIASHFISVVMKTSAIGSFQLDGTSYLSQFQQVSQDPTYSYLSVPVQSGQHTLKADSGFNAIAYGFGPAESYGYNAGANVKDLYQFVSTENALAVVDAPAACKNSPFHFKVTMPYNPVRIQWKFNGVFPDVDLVNPIADSTYTKDDRTLYVFELPTDYIYSSIGKFPVKIIATNTTSEGCSGEQEIDFEMAVYDAPKAKYSFGHTGCVTDAIQFKDSSEAYGRSIIKWLWDYGDGDTSMRASPSHVFKTPGDKKVTLRILTDIGCLSDTALKLIPVTTPPVPDFTTNAACDSNAVTFTDKTVITGGTISKWTWDYGQGTTQTINNPIHSIILGKSGTYQVKLSVESSSGCKGGPVTKPVIVNPFPNAAFTMPEVCLRDANAPFKDSSYFKDGSSHVLSYKWDFGNGQTSTQKDPSPSFSSSGNYQVTQMVMSDKGCGDTLTKTFTVNGAVPKAVFSLVNKDSLCSNQDIKIETNSSVDFGSIIKTEVYWDYPANPSLITVDEAPKPGKIYGFRYPVFGTPATKKVNIRVVAYSGVSCSNESILVVDLKASPEIVFDSLPRICEEVQPFVITQAKETTGTPGTFQWSGKGINQSGLFDPNVSGSGNHILRYTFTGTNGCISFKERTQVVDATPVANAGPDRGVLQNGSVVLMGSGSGVGISYLWSPSTALDNPTSPTPKASPLEETLYTLTVTSNRGCVATDQTLVKILLGLKIPNTFTPNNDGINDTWDIQYLDSYEGCVVEIYNPQGQRLFRSVGYGKPWDGKYNGNPLPVGTYYYVIDPKNGAKAVAGYVTILR